MKFILFILLSFWFLPSNAQAYSQELANTAMQIWPDSFTLKGDKTAKWRYDQGVILKGIEGIWRATGDPKWFNYIQKSMDFYVKDDGTIKGYRPDEYNIDHINNGKLLLLLYEVTGKAKYRKAADLLRSQLNTHPRTKSGGFWHKKIYPYQMWLDGLYMGQPFYAEYAKLFGQPEAFNDITRQFVLMEQYSRDAKTGLLYHGWDESREQKWADPKTGRSPNVWGRALGWYGMALVDVLDHFPVTHKGRDSIIQILNRFAKSVVSVQDKNSGLWYDVPDKPNEKKNYFEASASSMLVYTLAKGVRKGYLPQSFLASAKKAYAGIMKEFVNQDSGRYDLHGTVAVSGLGGKPYRDGSFEYYMSEPVIVNDPKGMGAFINAAVEMEMPTLQLMYKKRTGRIVLLDNYFNDERKKDTVTGITRSWHYTWNDQSNGGFSFLGNIFNSYGWTTGLIYKPGPLNLKIASVYIIADPDHQKDAPDPKPIAEPFANEIAKWVLKGGILILLGNDAGNTDLAGLNRLSSKFGIVFNEDNVNMVKNNQFDEGEVVVDKRNPIFPDGRKLFIKELSTLSLRQPSNAIVEKNGKAIIALVKYGKGYVLAVGDPWLYNEYVDGRKLPEKFQNYQAAEDLVKWLTSIKSK